MSAIVYRRGSIFWALTLIAVGAIFLFQNFYPQVHPWQILAKYWPVLIIFWGLSKLIDHIQARAHPEVVPPPLFSGSEVILLILILILGTLVSKIVLHPWRDWAEHFGINADEEEWANPFLDSFTYTKMLSQPLASNPHVVIVDPRGDVELRASDQPTLDGVVKATIRADSEEDAQKIWNQVQLSFAQQAGQEVFKTNLDSLSHGGRSVRLDLTLHVPRRSSTEITAGRGDILLDGLQGNAALSSGHGDVHVSEMTGLVRVTESGGATEIRNVRGNVEIQGRGGDVDVANVAGSLNVNGEFSGSVRFQNVTQTARFLSSRTDLTAQSLSGKLDMEMGSLEVNGIDGPFDISTRQKDLTILGFKQSVRIRNTNGDVELRAQTPPTRPIEVSLEKGDLELELPASSNFEIEAVSNHGEVASDFSAPSLKVNSEGDRPTISGTYGKGGPLIRLSTAYGTIHLMQGSSAPAQAAGGASRATRRLTAKEASF